MQTILTVKAPAKINFSLNICGKREDGYHLLQSLVAFTKLSDELVFSWADASFDTPIALNVSSEFALPEDFITNNLVTKAAHALLETCGKRKFRPVHIHIHKNIPLGAGLGGGSADAAAALKALNSIWQLNLNIGALSDIAATFGSDIAACLYSRPLWMEDTGNILTAVTLKLPPYILLAHPRIHACTRNVYGAFDRDYKNAETLPAKLSREHLATYLTTHGNDLETPAISLYPQIATLLKALRQLPHAQYARMSGSGSACFACFDHLAEAMQAEAALKKQFPDDWIMITEPHPH